MLKAVKTAIAGYAFLAGLAMLAVTQPILGVFGNSPEQVGLRELSTSEFVVFAFAVGLVPAFVVWVPTAVVGLWSKRAQGVLYSIAVAGAAYIATMQILVGVGATGDGTKIWPRLAAGVGVALLAVWLQRVSSGFRMWGQLLFLATPVLIGVFLFGSPAGDLMLGTPPTVVDAERSSAGVDDDADPLPNVVMVVLDSLPTNILLDAEGQIDRLRYPELAEFADSATWYRSHTTVSSETTSAVPALLTAMLPVADKSATWVDHPNNLFRLLGGSHRMVVSESPTRLCPRDWCGAGPGLAQPDGREPARLPPSGVPLPTAPPPAPVVVPPGGFSALVGDAWSVFRARVALRGLGRPSFSGFEEATTGAGSLSTRPAATRALPEATAANSEPPPVFLGEGTQLPRVQEFRAAIGGGESPALYFLHVILPHAPYTFTPSGQVYQGPVESRYTESSWGARVLAERLSAQMQFTDSLLGGIFDDLKRAGIYDDSVVVVVSDHAAGLDDTKLFRYYDGTNASSLMVTPLFIKAPGQRDGSISDQPVESVDVLPTMAEVIGIDVPWPTDGSSVLSRVPRQRAGCDDVRHFVRFGDDVLEDDSGVDTFELCATDILPLGLRPILGSLVSGDEWATAGLARFSPFAELLGRDWADLAVGSRQGQRRDAVELKDAAATLDGGPTSVGIVSGAVVGPDRSEGSNGTDSDAPQSSDDGPPEWIVVAVDGRVAGVSQVFDRTVAASATKRVEQFPGLSDAGPAQFEVIVPQELQHAGGYDIRVAAVSTEGDRIVLTELPLIQQG